MIVKDWVDMNQRERAASIVEMCRNISIHRSWFVLEKFEQVAKECAKFEASLDNRTYRAFMRLHAAAVEYVAALREARALLTPDFPKDCDE